MKDAKNKQDRIMRGLAVAYRARTTSRPSAQWHKQVMAAIRNEVVPDRPLQAYPGARLHWYAAGVAACMACVVTVWGLYTVPSKAQLAWELQRDGAVSAWLLETGDHK